MKAIALATTIATVFVSTCFAQTPTESSPEKAAIMANVKAFEAAYAKADSKTLAGFFTEDAEYTTDDGRTFSGRAEIEQAIRAALLANKGAKLSVSVNRVRALSPDVVVEKGSSTLTHANGDADSATYSAVHTKVDGGWKMSELIETPIPVATPGERLSELSWLIGEWEDTDKKNELAVRSQFVWARGGNFLTRNVTVKRSGQTMLEGWQIIGWDPLEERIRSWTFDGEGGFAEGRWSREGERWLLREHGIAPDGSRTTADNTFTKVSADQFTWESYNRTLDGEPQPSISRIEVSRVKGN